MVSYANRGAGHAVKILICHDNENACTELTLALEAAGHQVVAGTDPHAVASAAVTAGALEDASALLVEPAEARRSVAILRDRGFAGRALLIVNAQGEEPQDLQQLGLDGVLSLTPAADLVRRFAIAMGGRRRVLVVEGDEAAAKAIQRQVEEAGFEASWVPDVERATHLVTRKATRPDLVLLDLDLPRVSGPQFCRFLKRNERFRSIKVVLCSNQERRSAAAAAVECGADAHISKKHLLGPSS